MGDGLGRSRKIFLRPDLSHQATVSKHKPEAFGLTLSWAQRQASTAIWLAACPAPDDPAISAVWVVVNFFWGVSKIGGSLTFFPKIGGTLPKIGGCLSKNIKIGGCLRKKILR